MIYWIDFRYFLLYNHSLLIKEAVLAKKKKKTKEALIVGGASGLGAELAKLMLPENVVTITGTTERRDRQGTKPNPHGHCRYVRLEVTRDMQDCLPVLKKLAETKWDTLVWSAGFEGEDPLECHSLEDIELLTNLGFIAPALLVSCILEQQRQLGQLVLISGMVQHGERAVQPVMGPIREAMGALAQSMWKVEHIQSVLHAAPDRMKGTWYYTGTERDTSGFADVKKVAERIFAFMRDHTKYRELHFSGEVASVHRQDYSQPIIGEKYS